jgi:uncharacterized repeat protein (TIGR01451 family)
VSKEVIGGIADPVTDEWIPREVGEDITYKITVYNGGWIPAEAVILRDSFNADVELVSMPEGCFFDAVSNP